MRPVKKGISPVPGDFKKYEDAKAELVTRLGCYCSYCERRIPTLLAIEHIEPKKGPWGKPALINRWSNFLLACTNCNSCKGDKKVSLSGIILPDRDNTFDAYCYEVDGTINVNKHLTLQQQTMARKTLQLTGLDKPIQIYLNSNDEQVALDRVAQRMDAFGIALEALSLLNADPNNDILKRSIKQTALSTGFFSIWMKVFESILDMKILLIQAFEGTELSGCFDMTSGNVRTPAPNPDGIPSGGKI